MGQNKRIALLASLLVVGILFLTGFNFYIAGQTNNKEQFGDQVRAYLLENPKIIREVIEELGRVETAEKEQQNNKTLSKFRSELENDGYSFVAGNPDGDVTIVEFFDYRCGYCKQSFPDLMKTVEADGNIRLVLKEFPILGEESVLASRAAMAAQMQNKYMEFHVALMENRGSLSLERLTDIAQSVGINVEQFKTDIESPEITNQIGNTYQLANALNISGTPAFIIGGQLAGGAIPQSQMTMLVEQARAKSDPSATN